MPSESTGKSTEQETKNDGAKPRRLHFSLPLAVALLGVLATLGVCWMLYQQRVATMQEYFMERNFRYLTGRGENLGQVIAGYEKMFQAILHRQSLGKEHASECGPGLQPKAGTAEEAGTPEKWLRKQFCDLPHVKRVTIKEEKKDVTPGGPSQARFIGNDLQLDYRYDSQKDSSPVSTHNSRSWLITAQVDLAGILKLLPVEPIFGDLLLTDSQGTVMHQRRFAPHSPEYRFANIATLLKEAHRKQGDKDREPIVPPIFEEFTKGKTKYLIFGQAVRWPFGQATAKKGQAEQEPFDFLVVGILPSHDFYDQAKTIPTSYLLVTIGLILAGALSFPYMRLQSMRSSDALSQGDVLALLYCTVLWVGAVTFLVVILATFLSTREEFDIKLKKAASEINVNFVRDVEDAKKQLEEFDNACKQECRKNAKFKQKELWSEQLTIARYDSVRQEYELKFENTAESYGKRYPLFYDLSKVLWVDEEGRKRVDWSWKTSERQVPLNDREYVKQIRSGRHFWIESIYSWTTGENFAMVSKKSDVVESADRKSVFVVALQGKLPSVMDTVVLPGMGFAVIDQEGGVQFHSDSHRNLRENFIAETDYNEKLRAAVWTGKSEPFSGQYWGKDRRFYVTPVKWERCTNPGTTTDQKCLQGGRGTQEANGPPKWWLVVYLDQDVLEAPLLEAGFFAVALFVLYAVLILGVGLFWLLINRLLKPEHRGLSWPDEKQCRTYAVVSCLNAVLLLLYGAITFYLVPKLGVSDQSLLITLPGIVLLPSILVLVIHYLSRPTESCSWFPKRLVPDYRLGYLLMAVSSLLLFAMLPAFDFFTMAYKEEIRLYVEFSQFDYRNDSEAGRQRLRDFYATKGESKSREPTDREEHGFADKLLEHRESKLKGLPVKTFLFSPAEQSTLSSLLPVYAALRRLFTTQFGTETARFLEKGTDPNNLTDPKNLPPAVPCYLYWGLIAFGLLPCLLWRKLVRQPDLTLNRPDGTVPKDISIRLFVLGGLSIGLFVGLIWPGIGFLLMSALVFAYVSYGLPSMVAGQVFFLWEPRKHGGSQGDIRAQLEKCSPSEKWALIQLAHDLFLTAKSKELAGLKRKGLVRFAPNLQLVDSEELRAGIKEMSEEGKSLQEIREIRKGSEDLWKQAIVAMKVGLFGLAGFILFTQEEFRPAVLAALVPALPTLLRLPLGLDPSKLLDLLTLKKKG